MKPKKEPPGVNTGAEFTEECMSLIESVGEALYVIGGKWKLIIIIAIARGNKRFTDIQRSITGISARVLSNELRQLELNGFIIKKVSPGYPVTIEYELTHYANSLDMVVSSLKDWGAQHRAKIKSGDLADAGTHAIKRTNDDK